MGGNREDANAAVIGLVVAIGLFAGVFATLLDSSYLDSSATTQADSRVHDSIANRFVDQIVGPGSGWYEGQDAIRCVGGRENPAALTPDSVGAVLGDVPQGQFGLGEEECGGHIDANHGNWLSYTKIANLYNAQMDASINGHVDYEEARRSLGLDENNLGFHVRASPVGTEVADLLGGPASTPLLAAYIGDFFRETTTASGSGTVSYEAGATDSADLVTLWVTITNDGTTPAPFAVDFSIPLSAATVDVTRHTPIIHPDETVQVLLQLWKSRDWTWSTAALADPSVAFTVRDVDGALVSNAISLAGITMTIQQRHEQVFVEAPGLWTTPGGTGAPITYSAFDGTGVLTRTNDWTLAVRDSASTIVAGPTRLDRADTATYTFTTNTVGAYTVDLLDDRETLLWNTDTLNILADVPQPFTSDDEILFGPPHVEAAVFSETVLVDEIVGGFDSAAFDTEFGVDGLAATADGDIYPDFANVLDEHLASKILDDRGTTNTFDDIGRLDAYDVIIVGSDVDHAELGTDTFSRAISAWVASGGTLIVFGSDAQDFGWLEHLAGSGIVTANGGLYAVDEDHPLLSVPNQLDYISYQRVSGWLLNSRADRFFTHVLREGPNANDGDLLAVSNGGSFGQGRVVLAGYRPAQLTTDQATTCVFPLPSAHDCQAARFLENAITQSYRQLMLDFGPPIPEEQVSGAAHRIVLVDHPDLGDPVVLRLTAYVFRQ